jgi:SAM-dependent methyltransferase
MPDDRLGGWIASAPAYIAFQDNVDPNRTLLLDPIMLMLCGDVSGLRVLDLGCGEGRFSRMLAERGARCMGLDLIGQMTRTARHRDASRNSYVTADAARVPAADGSFDLVVSFVTMVDFPDIRSVIAEIGRVLRPGGHLVVANLGFVTATALPTSGWVRDADRKRLYYAVDRYADEFPQWFEWAGLRIKNYHRPLSTYMQAYLRAGLILKEFEEPMPADQSLREDPQFEDWFRVPLFTVMRWEKPAA